MYINVKDVSITPQNVTTGSTVLLTVKVELTTYQRLKNYIHSFLSNFTHSQLGKDPLD